MKNIIFDVGNVLIDFHWKATMAKLGIPDEAIAALGANMVEHPLWNHYDLDDIPEAELIARFKELSPEYSGYIDLFLDNIGSVIDMYEGADIWLDTLHRQGYGIYLLSNYPRRMFELHMKRFYFLPYTDGRVVSYEYHVTKPSPAIYRILCDKYGIKPEESIFLDDRQINLDAAKSLGFSTLLVNDPFEAREQLDVLLKSDEGQKAGAYE